MQQQYQPQRGQRRSPPAQNAFVAHPELEAKLKTFGVYPTYGECELLSTYLSTAYYGSPKLFVQLRDDVVKRAQRLVGRRLPGSKTPVQSVSLVAPTQLNVAIRFVTQEYVYQADVRNLVLQGIPWGPAGFIDFWSHLQDCESDTSRGAGTRAIDRKGKSPFRDPDLGEKKLVGEVMSYVSGTRRSPSPVMTKQQMMRALASRHPVILEHYDLVPMEGEGVPADAVQYNRKTPRNDENNAVTAAAWDTIERDAQRIATKVVEVDNGDA